MKNKDKAIKVWGKQPGYPPSKYLMLNNLEGLQNFVNGPIECITISSDVVLICNKEGRLMDLPYNCTICGHDFVGPIIFAGIKDDEFTDCPMDWTQFERLFPKLWEVE